MTTLLSDIRPWTGHIVPGHINPLFRAGPSVNMRRQRVKDITSPATTVQPNQGLGENHLIKQLVNVLQKTNLQSKITEAIPQFRAP